MNTVSRCLGALGLALCTVTASAAADQAQPAPVAAAKAVATAPVALPDMTIDAAVRAQAIDELAIQLAANYVFPDVAAKMTAAVRARQQQGEYDAVASARQFAELLGAHLREVSHDKHIRVNYLERALPPEPTAPAGDEPPPDAARQQRILDFGRLVNFGFAKYEQLEGNVGYLELRGFLDADSGKQVAAAAMNMVANAHALIIDLRRNGGGSPQMVAFVSSYLFGAQRVHLNDLYFRPSNKTEEFWTNPDVPGTRYGPDKPVYVLTSKRTFSGAEEFTYNLKNLKRATIVGETTGGGANPGRGIRTGEHFLTFIPTGRAINPITRTNWEGTGIAPDVAVAPEQALKTAHLMALTPIAAAATDPRLKADLDRKVRELQSELGK
jgi:hypothetical protein